MFELAKTYKQELILGLEIRDKVANFAGEKINTLRINSGQKECLNLGVLRTNAMKSMHNYFKKESVSVSILIVLTNPFEYFVYSWRRCSSVSPTHTSRRATTGGAS